MSALTVKPMPNFVVISSEVLTSFPRIVNTRLVMCPKHMQERQSCVLTLAGPTADPCYLCDVEFYSKFRQKVMSQPWIGDIYPEDLVYISGPMSGIENHNKPAFWLMEHVLRQTGCKILSPAHHPEGQEYSWYMRQDLGLLMQATKMVILQGYAESRGACLEMQVGKVLEIPFFYER